MSMRLSEWVILYFRHWVELCLAGKLEYIAMLNLRHYWHYGIGRQMRELIWEEEIRIPCDGEAVNLLCIAILYKWKIIRNIRNLVQYLFLILSKLIDSSFQLTVVLSGWSSSQITTTLSKIVSVLRWVRALVLKLLRLLVTPYPSDLLLG